MVEDGTVEHGSAYLKFIKSQGVGKRDVVASSPDSALQYLNRVSRELSVAV